MLLIVMELGLWFSGVNSNLFNPGLKNCVFTEMIATRFDWKFNDEQGRILKFTKPCLVYNLKFNLISLSSSQSWRSNLFFRSCLLTFLINEPLLSQLSHEFDFTYAKYTCAQATTQPVIWGDSVVSVYTTDYHRIHSPWQYSLWLFASLYISIKQSFVSIVFDPCKNNWLVGVEVFYIEFYYSLMGINECNIY